MRAGRANYTFSRAAVISLKCRQGTEGPQYPITTIDKEDGCLVGVHFFLHTTGQVVLHEGFFQFPV